MNPTFLYLAPNTHCQMGTSEVAYPTSHNHCIYISLIRLAICDSLQGIDPIPTPSLP